MVSRSKEAVYVQGLRSDSVALRHVREAFLGATRQTLPRSANAMAQCYVTATEDGRGFESPRGTDVTILRLQEVYVKEYSIGTRPNTSWRGAGPSDMVGLSE